MKQRHKGKKSRDTCSCWACRSLKFRILRYTIKTKALSEELKMDNLDDDLIFDYKLLFGYP